MSGRCKSCDCVLSDDEMVAKFPGTSTYTDLCFNCMSLCDDSDSIFNDDFDPDHISIDDLPESLE